MRSALSSTGCRRPENWIMDAEGICSTGPDIVRDLCGGDFFADEGSGAVQLMSPMQFSIQPSISEWCERLRCQE